MLRLLLNVFGCRATAMAVFTLLKMGMILLSFSTLGLRAHDRCRFVCMGSTLPGTISGYRVWLAQRCALKVHELNQCACAAFSAAQLSSLTLLLCWNLSK